MTDAITKSFSELAKEWRTRNRYSRPQLSELTGYSPSAIQDIEEAIYRSPPHPVSPEVMRRYRLICAAVEHKLTDWEFTDRG
jgi:hypothetical protein